MTTVGGRLPEDPALPNGVRFVLLSHNTGMGAARGAVPVAEYLVHRGWVQGPGGSGPPPRLRAGESCQGAGESPN